MKRKRKRSRKQIQAAKENIKKAQRKSPAAQAKPNPYTNGRDFDFSKRENTVDKFFETHNRAQEIYMHAITHSPAGKGIPASKRKKLHDEVVRRHFHKYVPKAQRLKVHATPIRG